jgi:hypothetical protein
MSLADRILRGPGAGGDLAALTDNLSVQQRRYADALVTYKRADDLFRAMTSVLIDPGDAAPDADQEAYELARIELEESTGKRAAWWMLTAAEEDVVAWAVGCAIVEQPTMAATIHETHDKARWRPAFWARVVDAAMRADPAKRPMTGPLYPVCGAVDQGRVCSQTAGHGEFHVARSSDAAARVLHTWRAMIL